MGETGRRTEAWPKFVRLFARLREESESGTAVVVVEGERDRRSLRGLGLRGPIALVHGGGTLAAFAARLARGGRKAIVLTDWDLEGGHLARRLREFLEAEAVGIDLEYRRKFARILRGEITHVEGMNGWARRVAEEAGTPIDGEIADAVGLGDPTG
ncbi:MAG: topoisomerase [Thermoplasmata archaeon]|nr:topoisomerase [Thermoplasmata archaeon]MCI4355919.1 topoisomerase [Thermoplasmata archaeon]